VVCHPWAQLAGEDPAVAGSSGGGVQVAHLPPGASTEQDVDSQLQSHCPWVYVPLRSMLIWQQVHTLLLHPLLTDSCCCCCCCCCCCPAEPLDEPPSLLRTAVAAAGLAPDAFITLQHGARMEVEGGRLLNQPLQLPVQKPS
jgi:hypothetical protein